MLQSVIYHYYPVSLTTLISLVYENLRIWIRALLVSQSVKMLGWKALQTWSCSRHLAEYIY